jgi:N-acetylglucosamine-6-phosphate deacetylase
MKRLVDASQDTIAIVTLAPELPGALPLITFLNRLGVRVQMGHSRATKAQALAGLKAGADGLTHLFNAMAFHHREPGLLGGLLQSKALSAEIITDGEHVSWDVVAWAAASLPGQLYAVSDGCSALGATPAQSRGGLTLGPVRLRKQGNVAVVASTGVLAGGATPLPQHPKLLKKGLKSAGLTLPSAIQSGLFTPPDCPKLKARLMRVWSESG